MKGLPSSDADTAEETTLAAVVCCYTAYMEAIIQFVPNRDNKEYSDFCDQFTCSFIDAELEYPVVDGLEVRTAPSSIDQIQISNRHVTLQVKVPKIMVGETQQVLERIFEHFIACGDVSTLSNLAMTRFTRDFDMEEMRGGVPVSTFYEDAIDRYLTTDELNQEQKDDIAAKLATATEKRKAEKALKKEQELKQEEKRLQARQHNKERLLLAIKDWQDPDVRRYAIFINKLTCHKLDFTHCSICLAGGTFSMTWPSPPQPW